MKYMSVFFIFFKSYSFSLAQAVKVHDSNRAQVETPIAVNPTNPDNLVGDGIVYLIYQRREYGDLYIKKSADGGQKRKGGLPAVFF